MGAFSIFHLLFLLAFVAIPLFIAYWLIRLGVRHGMQDVQRTEVPQTGSQPPPN
jgi:hypothetical protein